MKETNGFRRALRLVELIDKGKVALPIRGTIIFKEDSRKKEFLTFKIESRDDINVSRDGPLKIVLQTHEKKTKLTPIMDFEIRVKENTSGKAIFLTDFE